MIVGMIMKNGMKNDSRKKKIVGMIMKNGMKNDSRNDNEKWNEK